MNRVLINASNLHTGGALQVATSILTELVTLIHNIPNIEFHVYASTAVDASLKAINSDTSIFRHYSVVNVYGLQSLRPEIANKFKKFDAVLSIFGPFYTYKKIKNHIIGFAQAWILYPNNEANNSLSFNKRLLLRLIYIIKWYFFRWSASRLVVELPHAKERLVKFKQYPSDKIDIVNNCVASLYFDATKWQPISLLPVTEKNVIKIGYITRSYPHKNIEFLLEIARQLNKISHLDFKFYVTLTHDEWENFSSEFRSTITNIGPLTVNQCPTFYQAMDAVIFTSLLECFSATPLEAMAMKKALFASDRNFVHDCCGENAIYIDPLNAIHASQKIHNWFAFIPEIERRRHIEKAYQHLLTLPSSRDRALSYLKIIEDQLKP